MRGKARQTRLTFAPTAPSPASPAGQDSPGRLAKVRYDYSPGRSQIDDYLKRPDYHAPSPPAASPTAARTLGKDIRAVSETKSTISLVRSCTCTDMSFG